MLASANALDQTTQEALIKVLNPVDPVPTSLICVVVNGLGYGSRRASVFSQQLLLKWMVMIHDFLEDSSILSKFYSVFFNLLSMSSLRSDLCPLLARITRRKHVKPFRVQMLQDLNKKVGREHALSKLLQVYDLYAPDSLNIEREDGRVPEFSHPDPEWANQFQRIRERTDHAGSDLSLQREPIPSFRRGDKGLRLSASVEGSYNLDRIENAEDLVNSIEKIRITELETSDLDDPVLQRYLALDSDQTHTEVVNECLSKALTQQLDILPSARGGKKPLGDVLSEALAYTRYVKVGARILFNTLSKQA